MRFLIINADDFGLTKGCSEAIMQLFEQGIVTSTTIMATGEYFPESAKLAQEQNLNVGVHLCLTYGYPVLPKEQVNSLLDSEGRFKKLSKLEAAEFQLAHIEAEWRAQIAKVLQAGLKPDHLDSHHYVHETLGFGVLQIAVRLAKEFNLPLRQISPVTKNYCLEQGIKTTAAFSREFYGPAVSLEKLKSILAQSWQGVLELMCHPAYLDEKLRQISSYTEAREKEREILALPELKSYLQQEKIKLISFQDL